MIPLFFFLKNAFFFAIALFGWPARLCRCACWPLPVVWGQCALMLGCFIGPGRMGTVSFCAVSAALP